MLNAESLNAESLNAESLRFYRKTTFAQRASDDRFGTIGTIKLSVVKLSVVGNCAKTR